MLNWVTHMTYGLATGALLLSMQLLAGVGSATAATGSDIKQDAGEEVWAAAIAAYDHSDYEQALQLLRGLAEQGRPNGHIYFNLGNTYYRLGEKGKAMASYLEARRLLPRDPDVRANLLFVQEGLQDRLALETGRAWLGAVAFWVGKATPRELLIVAVAFWALAFCLWSVALWVRQLRVARLGGSVCFALALFCFFAWSLSLTESRRWGAVTVEKAGVKSGPGEHNTVVFELHEGAPFMAEQQENGWYRISLSDGKKGWISSEDALVWGQSQASWLF